MTVAEPQSTAAQTSADPEQLSEALAELHLSFGLAGGYRPWPTLSDTQSVREQMDAHAYISPDMDQRTRAAYFINRLANTSMNWVAWLDLAGYRLDDLTPDRLQVRQNWFRYEDDGEVGHYLSYRGNLPRFPHARQSPCRMLSTESEEAELGEKLIVLWSPLIDSVATESKLGKAAQWRLVTDALAAAYLNLGKRVGCVDAAMQRAQRIVCAAGKPLLNHQWHFLNLGVPATESPTGEALADWFRVRGGCCRYYTTGEHQYCGTCVLLPAEERKQRFQRALCIRAQDES